MMGVAIVLDLIVAAVLIVAVWLGIRRGFIKAVIGLIGVIAAAVLAAMLMGPLSTMVYDNFIEPPLTQAVENAVARGSELAFSSLAEQLNHAMEGMPELLRSLLQADGTLPNTDGAAIPTAELSAMILEALSPLCLAATGIVLFLGLFLVLFIAAKILGGLLDKVFSTLPVLKQANGLLGGVVGLAEGVLVVMVLGLVLELYMTFAGADALITREHLSATFLVKWCREWNPFLW